MAAEDPELCARLAIVVKGMQGAGTVWGASVFSRDPATLADKGAEFPEATDHVLDRMFVRKGSQSKHPENEIVVMTLGHEYEIIEDAMQLLLLSGYDDDNLLRETMDAWSMLRWQSLASFGLCEWPKLESEDAVSKRYTRIEDASREAVALAFHRWMLRNHGDPPVDQSGWFWQSWEYSGGRRATIVGIQYTREANGGRLVVSMHITSAAGDPIGWLDVGLASVETNGVPDHWLQILRCTAEHAFVHLR